MTSLRDKVAKIIYDAEDADKAAGRVLAVVVKALRAHDLRSCCGYELADEIEAEGKKC